MSAQHKSQHQERETAPAISRSLLSVSEDSNKTWIKETLLPMQIEIVNHMGSGREHSKSSSSNLAFKGLACMVICFSSLLVATIGIIGGVTNKRKKIFGSVYIVSSLLCLGAVVVAVTIPCEYELFKVSDESFGKSIILTGASAILQIAASCVLFAN